MPPLAGLRVVAVEPYGVGPFGSTCLADPGADPGSILAEIGYGAARIAHLRDEGVIRACPARARRAFGPVRSRSVERSRRPAPDHFTLGD